MLENRWEKPNSGHHQRTSEKLTALQDKKGKVKLTAHQEEKDRKKLPLHSKGKKNDAIGEITHKLGGSSSPPAAAGGRASRIIWNSRPTGTEVLWADTVGSALTETIYFNLDDTNLASSSFISTHLHQKVTQQPGDKPEPSRQKRSTHPSTPSPSPATPPPLLFKKSYREALLTPVPQLRTTLRRRPYNHPSSSSFSFKGRCFRCLGRDHRVSHCRDPLRCTRCFKAGHKARACTNRLPLNTYRAMRARLAYLCAFVPLSDDFSDRQNRRHNAILVDVIPPSSLGHSPQETIANGFARWFGGYPTDFHVAHYSERDYVVFLPEWVQSEHIVRREVLSLGDLRLRCYTWDPYRGARRPLLSYNVWVRLVSLPFECWSSRSVATIVDGFGRFIRADDFSVRMVDLTGYRCLIAVNHLSDIPENINLTFGDSSMSMLIQIERWTRSEGPGGGGHHQTERMGQHDPRDQPTDRRSAGTARGRRSTDGATSVSDASWNSSEIRDRRRPAPRQENYLIQTLPLLLQPSNHRRVWDLLPLSRRPATPLLTRPPSSQIQISAGQAFHFHASRWTPYYYVRQLPPPFSTAYPDGALPSPRHYCLLNQIGKPTGSASGTYYSCVLQEWHWWDFNPRENLWSIYFGSRPPSLGKSRPFLEMSPAVSRPVTTQPGQACSLRVPAPDAFGLWANWPRLGLGPLSVGHLSQTIGDIGLEPNAMIADGQSSRSLAKLHWGPSSTAIHPLPSILSSQPVRTLSLSRSSLAAPKGSAAAILAWSPATSPLLPSSGTPRSPTPGVDTLPGQFVGDDNSGTVGTFGSASLGQVEGESLLPPFPSRWPVRRSSPCAI
uniref:CCHC-type domain-containing protein n=1 Tax=Ananas comosus var. bracteatus TaxID=296719 RepID=A0A6V7NNY6_ANACO|nr:unnamed protein product [Ananas comosus var. bracteatus]